MEGTQLLYIWHRLPIHLRVMCPSLQTLPTQPVGSLGLQVLNKEERSRPPVEWFIVYHSTTEKKCPPPNQGWPEPPVHLTVMCKTVFTFQVISEICTPLPLSCNQTHTLTTTWWYNENYGNSWVGLRYRFSVSFYTMLTHHWAGLNPPSAHSHTISATHFLNSSRQYHNLQMDKTGHSQSANSTQAHTHAHVHATHTAQKCTYIRDYCLATLMSYTKYVHGDATTG